LTIFAFLFYCGKGPVSDISRRITIQHSAFLNLGTLAYFLERRIRTADAASSGHGKGDDSFIAEIKGFRENYR
jgi:hypothetical protein